jgi:transcriptional regulator with XRE-family HTH domain
MMGNVDFDIQKFMQNVEPKAAKLTFGQVLQKARMLQGLSINSASNIMQMAWNTLDDYEKDKKTPKPKQLAKLKRFYDLSDDVLAEYNLGFTNVGSETNIPAFAIEPQGDGSFEVFNLYTTSETIHTLPKPIGALRDMLDELITILGNKIERSTPLEKAVLTSARYDLIAMYDDLESILVIDEAF